MYRVRCSQAALLALSTLALAACRPAQAQTLTFSYSSFDLPGAYTGTAGYGTVPYGISNNGTIVGTYDTDVSTGSGFVLQNGSVTNFNYPGSAPGDYTYLYAVNSSGVIAGDYISSTGSVIPFISRNGSFTSPAPVNAVGGAYIYTSVTDSGLVATQYTDSADVRRGAIYNLNTDTFTDVAPVPISATPDFNLLGVNASGDYVGSYVDANGNVQGAFNQGGTFTYLSVPGAESTRPSGINANGFVTGRYFTSGSSLPAGGFLYADGTYYTLQYPGALATNVQYGAINDSNQIVGYYLDQNSGVHGMLITATAVPEPGSIALLVGTMSAGFALRRKSRKRLSPVAHALPSLTESNLPAEAERTSAGQLFRL